MDGRMERRWWLMALFLIFMLLFFGVEFCSAERPIKDSGSGGNGGVAKFLHAFQSFFDSGDSSYTHVWPVR